MAKGKKDNQYNGQREEGQSIQWPKERRTINTMAKEKKDNQYNGQRKKNDQRTNNDLRNIAYKTKVQATRTPDAPEG
jgi:hypothetical protein